MVENFSQSMTLLKDSCISSMESVRGKINEDFPHGDATRHGMLRDGAVHVTE